MTSVSALLAYLVGRDPQPGALFICDDGLPLLKSRFVEEVPSALTKAGLPAQDHVFLIGAATTTATVGSQDLVIQTLGRWKSSFYQLYTRTAPQHLAALSARLSSCRI